LGLEAEKSMHAKMIVFYIMGLSMNPSTNALFVDLINSIIEKMAVMRRIASEIEEKVGLKRYFGTFLSFVI
jgi:hypothetical protein